MKNINKLQRMSVDEVSDTLVICINPNEEYADFEYMSAVIPGVFYDRNACVQETKKWLQTTCISTTPVNVDVSDCEFLDGKYCTLIDKEASLNKTIVNRRYCNRTANYNCSFRLRKRLEQQVEKLDNEAQDYYNTILKLNDVIVNLRAEIERLKSKEDNK